MSLIDLFKKGCLAVILLLSSLPLTTLAAMKEQTDTRILVLFNTEQGGTYKLAQAIAAGIEKLEGTKAILKQVPRIKNLENESKMAFANIPYATINDLTAYDGIAFGSAVHFGNMSADMRYFLDQSVAIWTARKLEGIPATVFMSAGSGAGREAAILSFWNTLAIHGMTLVPTGIMGSGEIDKNIPQGNTSFGAASLAGAPGSPRPSSGELQIATLQGYALAKAAKGQQLLKNSMNTAQPESDHIEAQLRKLGITLPDAPKPVGNYKPYKVSGKLVFINQIALKQGKIEYAGKIEEEVTEEQAKIATRQTLLNILAVLKEAAGGNLDHVKQAVQLTGYFYTSAGYTKHAMLMNEASDLLGNIFKEKGLHTRATIGAASLPMNSPVEIQAVFELE